MQFLRQHPEPAGKSHLHDHKNRTHLALHRQEHSALPAFIPSHTLDTAQSSRAQPTGFEEEEERKRRLKA